MQVGDRRAQCVAEGQYRICLALFLAPLPAVRRFEGWHVGGAAGAGLCRDALASWVCQVVSGIEETPAWIIYLGVEEGTVGVLRTRQRRAPCKLATTMCGTQFPNPQC